MTTYNLKTYVKSINRIPLLSAEEELTLIKKAKRGDETARNKLIESNLRLVLKTAHKKRFKAYQNHLSDLVQEGNIGLIRAIEKFDTRMNYRFSTYAVHWVEHYICRYITNKRRLVRLPVYKEELIAKIAKTTDRYHSLFYRNPTVEEISEEIRVGKEAIKQTLQIMNEISFENNLVFTEDSNLSDVSYSEFSKYSPEQICFKNMMQADIEKLFAILTEREQKVIRLRYAFGYKKHTLKEVGEVLRVTPETIRKIESVAIQKLQHESHRFKEYRYL